jgi:uncharacterized UBP type Zn finger protein
MRVDDYPEPIKLPSPEELLTEKQKVTDSAIKKLQAMGFTSEEAQILTNTYYLFG